MLRCGGVWGGGEVMCGGCVRCGKCVEVCVRRVWSVHVGRLYGGDCMEEMLCERCTEIVEGE